MNQLTGSKHRVQSIDILRGIVMIIMALDHVRDFFHADAFLHDPINPETTTPALYFTRWITHLCAPVFVFLSGTSCYLQGLRKSKKELSLFLIKRGCWLILAEVLIVTFGITFNPLYNMLVLQVIWAIGISMVLLGLIIWLPFKVIFAIGFIIVFGHNLLDYAEAERNFRVGFWWDLLHAARFSFYPYANGYGVLIVYPFLAWTGIMTMGYCLGKWFEPSVEPAVRQKRLIFLGLGLVVLFVVLRFINEYGNPVPWKSYDSGTQTFLSFMNVHKYPPSLMYASITLGISLVALALFERVRNGFTEFVKIYGRVPFFYYVLHFYLIHILTIIAFYASGYGNKDIVDPNVPFLFRPLQFGFDLWVVYLVWIGVVLLLYPVCKWYNKYKSTHHQWWLSYV
jgi:uncharacterized membrane protein